MPLPSSKEYLQIQKVVVAELETDFALIFSKNNELNNMLAESQSMTLNSFCLYACFITTYELFMLEVLMCTRTLS